MLAISIRSGWLRFAHADVNEETLVVNSLKATKLPQNFYRPDLRSPDLLVHLGVIFHDVIESLPVHDKEVFLSLDERWIDCQIFPVDKGLTMEEQEAYLNWFLKRRLGPLWPTSSVFFKKVESNGSDKEWILTCVVPENALEALNVALERAGAVPVWLEPCTLSLARAVGGDKASVVFIKDGRSVRALFFFGGIMHSFGSPKIRDGVISMDTMTGDRGLASSMIKMINEIKPRSTKTPAISIKFVGELPGKWQGFVSSKKRHLQEVNPLDSFTLAKGAKLKGTDPSDFGEVAGLLHRRIM
ncbi:MAG TPA: hypothetical protein EYO34_11705 [Candidatus Marinimicrobia bacterium]|nr:hypothetical protein [Candidatus Neomarinimicrobiota bacterium]